MRVLILIFLVLIGLTIWSLVDKEPPSLVKPLETTLWPKAHNFFIWGDNQLDEERITPHLQNLLDTWGYDIRVTDMLKNDESMIQIRERLERVLTETTSWDLFLITDMIYEKIQWVAPELQTSSIDELVQMAQNRWVTVLLCCISSSCNLACHELFTHIALTTTALYISFDSLPDTTDNPDTRWVSTTPYHSILAEKIVEFLEAKQLIKT